VYENKQNADRMANEMSDIFGNSTGILQKNRELDGKCGLIGTFGAGFVRKFAVENCAPKPALVAPRLNPADAGLKVGVASRSDANRSDAQKSTARFKARDKTQPLEGETSLDRLTPECIGNKG